MGKTHNYTLLVSTLALSTNFGLRRITLAIESIPCFRVSLHVSRIEARNHNSIEKKRTDGNEPFEKILWGMVVVVVRRHGASAVL